MRNILLLSVKITFQAWIAWIALPTPTAEPGPRREPERDQHRLTQHRSFTKSPVSQYTRPAHGQAGIRLSDVPLVTTFCQQAVHVNTAQPEHDLRSGPLSLARMPVAVACPHRWIIPDGVVQAHLSVTHTQVQHKPFCQEPNVTASNRTPLSGPSKGPCTDTPTGRGPL